MAQTEKVKESINLRGICAAIQAMAMPTMQNLDDMLKKYGYTIKQVTDDTERFNSGN